MQQCVRDFEQSFTTWSCSLSSVRATGPIGMGISIAEKLPVVRRLLRLSGSLEGKPSTVADTVGGSMRYHEKLGSKGIVPACSHVCY